MIKVFLIFILLCLMNVTINEIRIVITDEKHKITNMICKHKLIYIHKKSARQYIYTLDIRKRKSQYHTISRKYSDFRKICLVVWLYLDFHELRFAINYVKYIVGKVG